MMGVVHIQFRGDKHFIAALDEAALHRFRHRSPDGLLLVVHGGRVEVAVAGSDGVDDGGRELVHRWRGIRTSSEA